MREIKFRGKRVDNKEWIYGSLIVGYHGKQMYCNIVPITVCEDCFVMPEVYLVIPETVGQYTGLKDVSGKEIYEGDIIDTGYDKWIVKFDNGSFYAMKPNTSFFLDLSRETINYYEIKVIGNIYDNPELIRN